MMKRQQIILYKTDVVQHRFYHSTSSTQSSNQKLQNLQDSFAKIKNKMANPRLLVIICVIFTAFSTQAKRLPSYKSELKQGVGDICNDEVLLCLTEHSECVENICSCKKEFYDYKKTCLPRKLLGDICETFYTNECMDDNAKCATHGGDYPRCECDTDFYQHDDVCLARKELGQSCDGDQCKGKGSKCNESLGQCVCGDDYYQFETYCIEKGNLHEICYEDIQCKPTGSYCLDNECICDDNHYEHERQCNYRKGLDELCNTFDPKECMDPNSSCKMSGSDPRMCKCNTGYTPVEGKCVKA